MKMRHRVFFFAISGVVAISAITYGVSELLKDNGPAWQTVELSMITSEDEVAVAPYYGEVSLNYFPYGSRLERTQTIEKVKEDYNFILSLYFTLFDPERNYLDENGALLHNLKYLNDHPNEMITLHPILYRALEDAYQKTISSNGVYNVFAGRLNELWIDILDPYLDGSRLDPLWNTTSKELIESVTPVISQYSPETFDLVFEETTSSVKFVMNEGFASQELIKLDLQILSHANTLEGIKVYLIERGWTQGILFSSYYGLSATLGPNPVAGYGGIWTSNIYYPADLAGDVPLLITSTEPNIVISQTSDYQSDYSYTLESVADSGVYDIARHPFFNAKTGYPENHYRSVTILSSSQGVVESAYTTLRLFYLTEEEVKEYLKANSQESTHFVVTKNEGTNPVGFDAMKVLASKHLEDLKASGYFIPTGRQNELVDYITVEYVK